jgi:hypothetical protein
VGEPVGLTGYVVVDIGEPEGFKPARGSWAQVSKGVRAVNNDGTSAVQGSGRGGVKGFQRDADRTGQMLVGVLGGGQHLNELGAGVKEGT